MSDQHLDPGNPQFLQQRITRFAVFGIIFTALIIGLSTGLPLYLYGKQDSEKSLQFNVTSQALAIREHLSRYQDIASQVTSRTKAREKLEEFNAGQINFTELNNSISPILSDAMSLSPDVAGITRVALDGKTKVKVGLSIPDIYWQFPNWNDSNLIFKSPLKIQNQSYLLVQAAINNRKGQLVGFDIVAYQLDHINQFVDQFSENNVFGTLNIAWKDNNTYHFLKNNASLSSSTIYAQLSKAIDLSLAGKQGLLLDTDVIAYAPVSGFNWAILITVSEEDLYLSARQEKLVIAITIFLIILLGIWGTHRLIRPLAGKILIHSDELRQEVDQKTTELRSINRALKALSAGNEAIVRSNTEAELLQQICNIVVELPGYKMAWVGVAQKTPGKEVKPVAQAGFEDGYLENLEVSWADNELGQGPTGKAIRSQKACVVDSIADDKFYSPWRKQAQERGYESSISLPIIYGFNAFGALNIYADQANAFENNEKRFLLQLANDITYGISMFRAQLKHDKAQEEMRKLSRAVEQADNMVLITNCAGNIEYVNPEFEKVTGYSKNEVLGLSPSIVKSNQHNKRFYDRLWNTIKSGKSFQEVFINRKKSGEFFYEEKTITPLKDATGEITHFVSTGKDISERINDQKRIEHMAYHDNLTNLPNRELFRDRLDHALAQSRRKGSHVAVMFLDLDRFKQVNDSLGHMIGDKLLKSIAERLNIAIREGDTIARIGGDEFTIICEDCTNLDDVTKIAQHIVENLALPFFIDNNEIYTTSSIGISIFPKDALNSEELLTAADTAMYRAKVEGRNNYQYYTSNMSDMVNERVTLEADLRRALKNEEFELNFQPRVNMKTQQVNCVEVLLRWRHPEKGLLLPDQFIAVLEETNLIVPVTEYVMKSCCLQLKTWKNTRFSEMCIAVNLSVNLFRQGKILEIANNIMNKCEVSVSQFELEITENILVEDIEFCISVLSQLKKLGFQISIDDFGTGFSSMSYLKKLPIDCVKIDKSFIEDLIFNNEDKAIVSSIISLAHSLKLKVTAEGVENKHQLEFLSKHGCDEGQGFCYSEPLTIECFEAWLCQWQDGHLKKVNKLNDKVESLVV